MERKTEPNVALLFQTLAKRTILKKIDGESFLTLHTISPMSFIVDQPKRVVGTINHDQFFDAWTNEFKGKSKKEALIPSYLTFNDQYVLMLTLFAPIQIDPITWQFKIAKLANEFLGEHDDVILLVIRPHPIDYPEVQALFLQTQANAT